MEVDNRNNRRIVSPKVNSKPEENILNIVRNQYYYGIENNRPESIQRNPFQEHQNKNAVVYQTHRSAPSSPMIIRGVVCSPQHNHNMMRANNNMRSPPRVHAQTPS